MGDYEMMEASHISETPHGASSGDSGYLSLTPRSGDFTPNIGSARSRVTLGTSKRHYRLRQDPRKSENRTSRLRSKLNSLINSSEIIDSPIDESQHEGSSLSVDSANFSCDNGRANFDIHDHAVEYRERRTRNQRRGWRSGAITPASRLQLLSPPPSPAIPSTSFVASEPIDEDVEMKLVIVPQSTPYSRCETACAANFHSDILDSSHFSPKTSKTSPALLTSEDNKKLSKLAIEDLAGEIKPKRLDFSQRALSYALHRTRATPDFTGKTNVDVITLLGEKSNHWRVVSKILSHLTPQDLCSISMVSKAWRRICANDSRANMRRLGHVILRQNTKENFKFMKSKAESSVMASPKSRYVRKGYLLEVQNLLQVPGIQRPPNSPPVSPSKVKFHSFVKASRTLEPWEHLLPCPNCSFPCHVDDEKNVGKCSRQGCSMEFCTTCSSRPHAGACKTPLLATPTKRNKRLIVGSRQSKRNLRRL